jgi:hypothetical protein
MATSKKMTVFWNVSPCSLVDIDRRFRGLTASIIKAMTEAVRTSETSASIYQTTLCDIPEGSHLPHSPEFFFGR